MHSRTFFVNYDITVQWSEREREAKEFTEVQEITDLCAELNLKNVEILVQYGMGQEIVLQIHPREKQIK